MPGLSRQAVVRALLGSWILASWMLVSLAPSAEAAAETVLRASAAPLAGVNIAGLDFGSTPARADQSVAAARQLHARVVRLAVAWSVFEPLGPSRPDANALAFTDRLVADAKASAIRVIMMVDSSPCWASSAPAPLLKNCHAIHRTAANSWPPSRPSDYAAFVAYLAHRYGGVLAAIEVWNEPDQINQQYFAGPDKPQHYAAILRAAYTAIKRADPQVPVLGGSLVGSNGVFLRALYAAGIRGHYDALAVHFYNLPLASLRNFREVQLASGDTTPLWLDEFGWSSCYPKRRIQEEQACVTSRIQGRNLADLLRSLARTAYVRAVVAYNLQNSGAEEFGVLAKDGARKPAFGMFSVALLRPFAAPSPVRLRLRRSGGRIVASGSGPIGDYMQLEVLDATRTPRFRAIFVLDRSDRYSIALPTVLSSHGLIVRVFQQWAGLGADAQRSI